MTGVAPVIRLTGAGKRYTKYEDQPMLLTSVLRMRARTRRSKLWALRGCTLEVSRGECIGVLGRNGSGKSTLLQMLAGVTSPTEGEVAVRGRVAPLVQVGVGFHPELTGRENVYVNGTILGLSRAEIEERFERIVDFAEITEFIDTPVKFYSSGMYVRLGFSVAIHAQPDVLLVDEVLAVGDLAFQAKCFERMLEIRETGTTMVIVSHNVHAIRRLCERSLVIHRGSMVFDGPTGDAISNYFDIMGKRVDPGDDEAIVDKPHGPVELEPLDLLDDEGRSTRQLSAGQTALFALEARFLADVDRPRLGFSINSVAGVHVYSRLGAPLPRTYHAGERIRCEVRVPVRLGSGPYSADAGLYDKELRDILAWSPPVLFHCAGPDGVFGLTDLEAEIAFAELDAAETTGAPVATPGSA